VYIFVSGKPKSPMGLKAITEKTNKTKPYEKYCKKYFSSLGFLEYCIKKTPNIGSIKLV